MRPQLVLLLMSFSLVLSLVPLSPLFPQEPEAEQAPPEPAESREGTLFERTLLSDLDTAPTAELLNWARSLGLSVRGSRRAVEDRILDAYGLDRATLEAHDDPDEDTDPPSSDAADPGGPEGDVDGEGEGEGEPDVSVLRIEQARGSDFFSVEETDEEYLRLTGGVVLTLDDGTTVHRIEAQEIVVNLSENLLSATGGVRYTTEQQGGTEDFRGETIVFRIDSWEGVFIHGITETRDSAETEEVDFSVQGERITRSAEEIIVVDGGTITSSQADPPNYRIRAQRIWILAPGEWGLRNAVLYVGRVPMFYLPAFFLPGDRLFFHPALGTRTREGQFIQTTTYLLGESDERDPPISIMRLADDGEGEDRRIEGLFLRVPDEPPPAQPAGWNLKVMLDAYTTLGAYAGVDAALPDLGGIDRLDVRLGLGASRNIYLRGGTYSSWYIDNNGQARQHWNTGWFLGRETPFRYEAELDTSTQIEAVSLSLKMLMLSDPEFRRDYGTRSEAIDWGVFLNSGTTQDATENGSSVSSTTWETSLAWRPSVPADLRPWVSSFSVRSLRARVNWQTRSAENLPDAVTRSDSDNSPELRFFYPESIVLPDMAVEVRGTLLDYPRSSASPDDSPDEEEAPQEDSPDLRPPWDRDDRDEEDQEERFRLPRIAPDAAGIPPAEDGAFSVNYTITPNVRYDRFTDNAQWESGSDVGFDWRYSTFQTRSRAELTTSANDAYSYLVFRNSLALDHRYQETMITSEVSESERDQLLLSAFQYRGNSLTQRTSLTGYPLRDVQPLEQSSLQYQLNSLAYVREFSQVTADNTPRYDSRWGEWTRDDVSTHRAQARFVWSLGDSRQRFTATSDIPPRLRSYLGELEVETGPMVSRLSGGYRETDDGWEPDNLVQNHQVSLFDDQLRFAQRFEYDTEAIRLEQTRTSLAGYGVNAALTGRHGSGYTFTPGSGWQQDATESFQWTNATVGVSVDRTVHTWKRRIDLALTGDADLDMDLQRFTNSSLLLTYGFSLDIYRFLELEFAARSRNDLIYQYVPSLAEQVDRPHRSLTTDLADSLRLFNRERRETTFFKLDSLTISAIHDLEDWELRLDYSGRPELDQEAQPQTYRWRSIFSILLRWRPIPELRRSIEVEDGSVEFGE
ncbi:MAG: hypothetical protein R6U25_05660 [Alkalispirochaeta sp.]